MGLLTVLLAALCAALLVFIWRMWRQAGSLEQELSAVLERGARFALLPRRHSLFAPLERSIHRLLDHFERERATAENERSWFRATLEAMQEGVLILEESGVVLTANPAARRLLGVEEPLEGRPLIELCREPAVWQAARDAASGTGPVEREVFSREHNLHLRLGAASIVGSESKRVLLVLRDVTAERRLEQVRRDFVANVSHELRTPLAAIQGYAETLLDGGLQQPEVARRFVEVIERNARRLARLAEDLMTLSNLELGRTRFEAAAVDPLQAAQHAVDAVRAAAGKSDVHIVIECPPQIPRVRADPDRLQQILVNLLDNAVKYSKPGGTVTVWIRETNEAAGTHLRPASTHGRWIEICVEDRGEGIPSRDLPRISERFYRVDPARSRASGGTGLGLAIVKHLVQLHGGALRIESALGQGTRVSVFLPSHPEPK